MGLSSFASRSIEDVAAVNDKTFFQMYWVGDRETLAARAERAKKAGAKGLIVTLDWSFSHGRDWGSPSIPEKMDLKTMISYIPEGITRPRWGLKFLRSGKIPDLTVPNIPLGQEEAPTFFGAYGQWMFTPPPTWADVAWLREQWDGPFCVKGVTRVDDAKRAVDAGATAIQVSNHGGNNLDSTPAPIRVLPGIVEAVGRDVEVIMDGGIRRGSDVVKALCLGARAVALGRAYLWGLAAEGETGVGNVLDIIRGGIDSGLLGLGKASVHDLRPEDLLIPPNFTRTAGMN
jgi:heme/flavin dehydrogenase (mycofactocin system)